MKVEHKTKKHLQSELGRLQHILLDLERSRQLFSAGLDRELFSTGSSDSFFSYGYEPQPPSDHSTPYHISELIDMSILYELFDLFYDITKIPYSIVDYNTKLLRGKGWQNICAQFHRVCPKAKEKCIKSDGYIFTHYQGEPYVGYKCLNGLMDYGAPIIVEGQYLASIYSGQFFHEPPDEAFFRQQAKELGLDEAAYMEAVAQVPIVPESYIALIMEFYAKLGQIFASIGLERLRQIESANQTIREHEESYKLILEASTDGFWHWDIQADQINVSPQLAALLGYPAEERSFTFNAWKALVHPQDINSTLAALYRHMDCKTRKFQVEHRIMTRTGKYIWVLSRGKVIARDKLGRPLRMACTCFDISDRKQTENALRLSEDRFAKAFNASPVSMCISTLEDGRLIAVNDSFCATLGYKREEIIGRTSIEIGLWRDDYPRTQITELIAEQLSVRDEEIHFFHGSGEVRLGAYSAEVFELDGIPCILNIVIDITEKRQIEIEMLRMDRLNLVGEMAASIGHEIRNPMTSIRGFLQIFREKYAEDQEFLNLMIGELDRANSIISEFLSLAKNKMVELKPLRLTSILKHIYPLLQANAALQDKTITLEISDEPYVMLDEKEIRQLLINLVYNGLEAMDAGGFLTIKIQGQGEDVILSVHDQGKGMKQDILSKLGTPFFTTKEHGTGLGLPVCYGIAARHNARIEFDTGPGGTTFMVYFSSLPEQAII